MNTPITFNSILAVLGVIAAIVAGATAIWAIVKFININHDRCQKWDSYDIRLQQIRTEQYILTDCMSAVLDGLHQLHCNGKVTEARSNLDEYLNKRAHEKE